MEFDQATFRLVNEMAVAQSPRTTSQKFSNYKSIGRLNCCQVAWLLTQSLIKSLITQSLFAIGFAGV